MKTLTLLQKYGVTDSQADASLNAHTRRMRRERRKGKLVRYERGQLRRALAR